MQYNNALAGFEFAKGTIMQHDNVSIAEGPLPHCAQVRAVEHEQRAGQRPGAGLPGQPDQPGRRGRRRARPASGLRPGVAVGAEPRAAATAARTAAAVARRTVGHAVGLASERPVLPDMPGGPSPTTLPPANLLPTAAVQKP